MSILKCSSQGSYNIKLVQNGLSQELNSVKVKKQHQTLLTLTHYLLLFVTSKQLKLVMCSARSASIASLWVTPESKRNAQFTHTRRTSNVSLFSDVSHLRLFHPSQTGLRVHLLLSHCLSMCRTYLVLPSRTAVKKHRGEASSTSASTKGTCRRPRLGFMLILSLVFFFYPSYILLLPQKTILYILKLAK